MWRECVVLVTVCVFGAGSLSGRGFFCRDPETGKLHPANSTWTASSFCGKYHCKLKKKNITSSEYAPLRQINITNIQLLGENQTFIDIQNDDIFVRKEAVKNSSHTSKEINTDIKNYDILNKNINTEIKNYDILNKNINTEIKNYGILNKNINTEIKNYDTLNKKIDTAIKNYDILNNKINPDIINYDIFNKNINTGIKHFDILKKVQGIKKEDEKDRYLSENEIKTISDLLHTVKKGDLDTIVEIYNLAQDIYKELDKTSTDHVLQEVMSTATTLNKETTQTDTYKKVTKQDSASYWYEPLSSSKVRPADLLRPDIIRTDINPEIPAVAIAIEKPVIVNVDSKSTMSTLSEPVPPSPQPNQIRKISDTFYSSPLTHKDFGKLPYYYPISNFQRMSSYNHGQKKTLPANTGTPAPVSTPSPVTSPTPALIVNYKFATNNPLNIGSRYQKVIRPSIFLPYPFTNIQHYNWSQSQNLYHKNIFDKKETYRKDDTNILGTITRRIDKQDNAVLMNPDLENFQDLQIRASMVKENAVNTNVNQEESRRLVERRKPEWQTEPLPQHILEDVRAHIQEKQRLFLHPVTLRKKVKLERVAKLLNLDQFARTKREEEKSTSDEKPLETELYEVYIEKTTCNADYSVPGYFRYGNLSQPFPECCPQRIPLP